MLRLRSLFPSWTWEQVAEAVSRVKPAWKISVRQCKEVKRLRDAEKTKELMEMAGGGPATTAYVLEQVDGLRELRQMTAQIATEASGGIFYRENPETKEVEKHVMGPSLGIALGAIGRMVDIRKNELELLQSAGLIPKNLGVVQLDLESRQVVEATLNVLRKYIAKKNQTKAARELTDALIARAQEAGTEAEPAAAE